MPATYEPIATTTLGSAAATIDFTSIAATYTDLRLVLVVRSDRAATTDSINLRFNSDTTTTGSQTTMLGDGSAASSSRSTSVSRVCNCNCPADTATSGIFGLIEYDIFSYAGSTNKTVLAKTSADRNGAGTTEVQVGLWRNTAAITSIRLLSNTSSNFVAGTTATLYGILKA